jgi:hypothetical protein
MTLEDFEFWYLALSQDLETRIYDLQEAMKFAE